MIQDRQKCTKIDGASGFEGKKMVFQFQVGGVLEVGALDSMNGHEKVDKDNSKKHNEITELTWF